MAIDFNDAKPQSHIKLVESPEDRKERVREAVHNRIESYIEGLLGGAVKQGDFYRVGNTNGEKGDSLAICWRGDRIGRWREFNAHGSAHERGDIFTLWADVHNLNISTSFPKVLDEIERWTGGGYVAPEIRSRAAATKASKKEEIEKRHIADWTYEQADGTPFMIVKRYDHFNQDGTPVMKEKVDGSRKQAKTFFPQHADGTKKLPLLPNGKRIIYNLPGIAKCRSEIIVVEGEKAAQALINIGLTATTHHGGSNVAPDTSDWSALAGRQLILWPDNEKGGKEFMAKLGEYLRTLGCEIRTLEPPEGKPETWDAADAVEEGEDVRALLGLAQARKKTPILSIQDVFKLPPPEYLIEGLLIENGLSSFYAPSSTYKSFVALDMALTVASGMAWRGLETKNGPVIYIVSEGMGGWSKRVLVWMQNRGRDLTEDPPFYSIPTSFDFTEAQQREWLIEDILETCEEPAMIIIDTLARNFGGGDENSTKDMNLFISGMDALRAATGAHVMLVHHTGKDATKGGRGSSALYGALDAEMTLERLDMPGRFVDFKVTKSKEEEFESNISFEMKKIEAVHPLTGEVIDSLVPVLCDTKQPPKPKNPEEDKLLNFLKERTRTTKEVAQYLNRGERGIGKMLHRMADKGQIYSSQDAGINYWNFYNIWDQSELDRN